MTTVVPLGPRSARLVCPHCRAEISTKITMDEPSTKAYIVGAVLCLTGCCFGCCLIPCCVEDCLNVRHECPHCQNYLGKYER